jgi:polyribonucleotide nucleotidyltransferase
MEATGIKEGDVISVKLLEIDERTGKMRLSRRALLEKPENWKNSEQEQRPRKNNANHSGGGHRHDNHRNNDNRERRKN